jgi:cytochrome oxidase Cu insertion factor (SCO1/SenC/PrrC family)
MFLIKNFIPKKFPKISLNFSNIKNNSYTTFKYNFNSFNFNNKMNQNRNNFENRPDFPEEMKNIPPKTDDIQKDEVYDSDSEDPSSFYNKRKKLYYMLTVSATVITGVFIGLHYLKPDDKIPAKKRMGEVTYVGKAEIGGPWKMTDTNGNIMTHKDLAGKYYLIYFGFTQCPDVCPMSLNKISKVLQKIRKSQEFKYFDLETIFVSVDPDRDSNDRIKTYCKLFDDKIIGVTAPSNDSLELKDMLKKFKIHSSKIYLSKEDEEEDEKNLQKNVPDIMKRMENLQPKINAKYSLDHTIVTYLMGPNNNFVTYLSANLSPDEMYNIVVDEIMNDLTKQLKSLPSEKK